MDSTVGLAVDWIFESAIYVFYGSNGAGVAFIVFRTLTGGTRRNTGLADSPIEVVIAA